jgi:hypothetical protein
MTSRQIGFRLDPHNPREAQALAVLEQGKAAGYKARHILTEALLALEASAQEEMATVESLRQIAGAMQQMNAALARLQSGQVVAVTEADEDEPNDDAFTEAFLVSVKDASKAGMTIDSE